MRQPEERDHVELDVGVAAGVSDRGLRHSQNEDAMAVRALADGVFAVVCDGVSSSTRPEEASQVAVDTASAVLAEQLNFGAEPAPATVAAIRQAAQAVSALAGEGPNPPACTYISAVVRQDAVTIGWLGDSRAYWVPLASMADRTEHGTGEGAQPAVLTVDDSLGGVEFVSHLLIGWLGADSGDPDPHVESFRPAGPGVLVVCSDGLWNYLPDPIGFARATLRVSGPPLAVARSLVQVALDGGGRDNITVVVVPFPPPGP